MGRSYLKRKSRRRTMFYHPPRHKRLADVIRISSPTAAKASVKEAKELVKEGYYSKTTVKRAFVLAANRSKAMLNRKNLSVKERRELRQVARIYRNAAKSL